ncbi:hypothetical protein B0T25DRAFT_586752 [Lasiosphaeria hispida]|uniref:Uncharacterized protein n=1 Tax=Lasiosphaeria hispida TaxID=260671 RepID=A0AAJ0HT80_9PEZI|nr:hypothetical protein B0T25DRAFT_586752 [Lasiosphaeria hispida]
MVDGLDSLPEIAGNAFTNSYLALDKAGEQRVEMPLDDISTDGQYYFIVEGSEQYPIVPSFQDWAFPHGRIPGCTAVDEAHLVHKEERIWYIDMAKYVTHIISRSAAELWPTYHTTLVESLHSDSRAYLFARFAWAILFRIKLFVTAGRHRHVIRLYRDQTGVIEYKTEYCTGTELQNADGGGGSKTATPLNPRKRNSRKK